jgi:hypothetical protein
VSEINAEWLDVGLLKADGKNPNKMSGLQFEALKKNISKYGFIVPIITNQDLLIADGEHRFRAAQELGLGKVLVIRLPLQEVDRRIIRQVMNKLKGEHDAQLDAEELAFIKINGDFTKLVEFLAKTENELMNALSKAIKSPEFLPNNFDEKIPVFKEELYFTFEEYETFKKFLGMTSSNALKCVVSDYETTTNEVAPRKPFNINHSVLRDTKSLLYGSLQGTTSNECATTLPVGGGRYDYKRISAFQSSKIQSGCEDSNCEDGFSLQIQHQLSYNMDSKVQKETFGWQGG